METIEIRQNKWTLIPMLGLLAAALLGGIYYLYFSGRVEQQWLKIACVPLTAALIYAIFVPTRKFATNEPVLTFNLSALTVNERGSPSSIAWTRIVAWKVEKEPDGGTSYLTIQTPDATKRIDISWLDKRPGEIEELLRKFTGGSLHVE